MSFCRAPVEQVRERQVEAVRFSSTSFSSASVAAPRTWRRSHALAEDREVLAVVVDALVPAVARDVHAQAIGPPDLQVDVARRTGPSVRTSARSSVVIRAWTENICCLRRNSPIFCSAETASGSTAGGGGADLPRADREPHPASRSAPPRRPARHAYHFHENLRSGLEHDNGRAREPVGGSRKSGGPALRSVG